MTEWTPTGPRIRVSAAFMAIPRSLREAGIWHEVGHIHYRHACNEEITGETERGTAFETANGDGITLQQMEAAADRFAAFRSSKEALRGFLEHLLRAVSHAGSNETERRKLKARIASIRSY